MSTATLLPAFQDLTDGPGELGPADEGKVPAWSWADRRLIMIPLPQPGSQQIIVRGGGGGGGSSGEGGTTNHAALLNLDYASAGHTGFEASGTAAAAISTHVGEADPHEQYALESALGTMATATETNYLLADGTRAGANSSLQAFTSGVVVSIVRPASDSATALRVQDAAGSADVVTVDTTTPRFNVSGRVRFTKVSGDSGNSLEITGGVNPSMLFHNGTAYGKFQIVDSGNRFFLGTQSAHNVDLISNNQSRARLHSDGLFFWGGTTTATAIMDVGGATTVRASLRVRAGTAPTTPNAGDIWDDGSLVAYNIDATTNAVVNSLKLRRGSSGTPAAGFGLGIAARLESSTTEDQDAGRLAWEWVTATHASRASRGKLSAYYTSTEQTAITWDGDTGGLKLAFYGGAPVAKAAAYTQTFATTSRTMNAYTADDESAAYTGVDNTQVGSVYATVADLNALRVAVENLRASHENRQQVINSVVDDLQALNLVG